MVESKKTITYDYKYGDKTLFKFEFTDTIYEYLIPDEVTVYGDLKKCLE